MNRMLWPWTLLIAVLMLGCEVEGENDSNNRPPTLSGTPPTQITVNQPYRFTPDASDPDNDTLTFSILNPPGWSRFDQNTGTLSGTPGSSDIGIYKSITLSVSDGFETVSLPAFDLTVSAANDEGTSENHPPQISGTPLTQIFVNQPYLFTPSASDPDGDPLNFHVDHAPAWSRFDPVTGQLSGTPGIDDIGDYTDIRISVSDGSETVSLPLFAIQVVETGNRAPEIGGTPSSRIQINSHYLFIPAASDADDDVLNFTIEQAPSWSQFDTTTGQLSGTPGPADVGVYAGIVITVSDGTEQVSLPAFTITVESASQNALRNYPGIPPLDQRLTQDPDGKGSDWQPNPEPWPSDPRSTATPDWPAAWPAAATANYWYIDNTHPSATDTDMGDNAIDGVVYGTPDRPRATLMGTHDFAPGSYVVIRGGPYNSGAGLWRFQCTENTPCWITGNAEDKAILAGSVRLVLEGSSWLTVENLLWDPEAPGAQTNTSNTAISTNYNGSRGNTHHLALRHIDFRRWSYIGGGGGIISVTSNNLNGGTQTHHILVYDISAIEAGNNAARGCDWTNTDCDNHLVGISTRVQDGVTTNRTHHIWVLDTRSDRISGNQVQAISLGGTVNVDWRETVHHIYVGGNEHSNSRQSGWWAKRSSNFIVSSCRSWGNRSWTGGNGQSSGMQYGPDWVWFIDNEFSDSEFGVQQTDTGAESSPENNGRLFVLGNLFYNLHRFTLPTKTDPWRAGFGVAAWSGNAKHYIAFNTCVDCESGLATKVHAISNDNEGAYVWNNIVHTIDDSVGTFVSYAPGTHAWVHNNLFWDDGAFRVNWDGIATALTDWQNENPGQVYSNIEANPLLSNTLTTYPERDYSLDNGSPARSAGATVAADGTDPFLLFFQRYGVGIAEDVSQRLRTTPYSIGAYQ